MKGLCEMGPGQKVSGVKNPFLIGKLNREAKTGGIIHGGIEVGRKIRRREDAAASWVKGGYQRPTLKLKGER